MATLMRSANSSFVLAASLMASSIDMTSFLTVGLDLERLPNQRNVRKRVPERS